MTTSPEPPAASPEPPAANPEPPAASPEPLDVARRYLQALERRDLAALEALTDDAIVVHLLPSRVLPQGEVRDRAALLESFQRGGRLLSAERYEVKRAIAQGGAVALEVGWAGELAVPLGSLAAGATMRAHFAMFLDVRGGRIVAQRNYDCFEPF